MSDGAVVSVSASPIHSLSKPTLQSITLVAGLGVEGDAHSGETVKHRSKVAIDPTQPNLRQVHLIHSELHEELEEQGFSVKTGQIGENITTAGLDLLSLPKGTSLKIGQEAVVEITGLRSPCGQLNKIQAGLMKATLDKDSDGNLVRKAGIMGIVLVSGVVKAGDTIVVELPRAPHQVLPPV